MNRTDNNLSNSAMLIKDSLKSSLSWSAQGEQLLKLGNLGRHTSLLLDAVVKSAAARCVLASHAPLIGKRRLGRFRFLDALLHAFHVALLEPGDNDDDNDQSPSQLSAHKALTCSSVAPSVFLLASRATWNEVGLHLRWKGRCGLLKVNAW